jgi:hypothetical protein
MEGAMRLSMWSSMGLLLLAWWSAPSPAAACSCAVSSFDDHYARADHVLHAKVLRLTAESERERVYTVALLERDFKGCLPASTEVQVATSPDSASCGVPLEIGAEVLLFATWQGQPPEATLRVSLCGGSGPFARFTDAERDALRAKPLSCGDDGPTCANGEPVVQCFVDPCSVSRCDVSGATCQSDYCGGCNAHWYDARGARVCAPAPACDYEAKDRRYFAKSRETCKQVRFACGPTEQMFIDDCGCGCVASMAPN